MSRNIDNRSESLAVARELIEVARHQEGLRAESAHFGHRHLRLPSLRTSQHELYVDGLLERLGYTRAR